MRTRISGNHSSFLTWAWVLALVCVWGWATAKTTATLVSPAWHSRPAGAIFTFMCSGALAVWFWRILASLHEPYERILAVVLTLIQFGATVYYINEFVFPYPEGLLLWGVLAVVPIVAILGLSLGVLFLQMFPDTGKRRASSNR